MRRTFLVFTILILISTATLGAAEWEIGASVGGNLSFFSTEGFMDIALNERTFRFGLTAGFYGAYEFHNMQETVYLSVLPGISYTMKGFRVDDLKINLDYLELPMLLKARIPLDTPVDPYLLIGPFVGINVVRRISDTGSTTVYTAEKKTDFGLIVGAGTELEQNLSVDLRATFGFVNTFESNNRNQNHSIALVVSYTIL